MLSAVIMDFDGVIADSEPLHLRAYQEVLAERGIVLSSKDYYERYLGFDDAGVFRAVSSDWKCGWNDDVVASMVNRKSQLFDVAIERVDILYPGAADCISRLAAAVPLAIASGAFTHEIEAILRRAGLRSHFRAIVGAGDTPRSKPHPDPYLRAVALLREQGLMTGRDESDGVAAPVWAVAIEDSHWGIESARQAGLRCVALTTTYTAGELSAADLIVPDLSAVTLGALSELCSR